MNVMNDFFKDRTKLKTFSYEGYLSRGIRLFQHNKQYKAVV